MRRLVPLFLIALAALVLPPMAQAVDPVLVSNTGQTAGTSLATTANFASYAQSFRTGNHPDGYFLTSVDVGLAAASGVTARVELWRSRLGEGSEYAAVFGVTEDFHDPRIGYFFHPQLNGLLAELPVVGSIDDDALTLETFSAHDVLLLPDTTYWIVVTRTTGADGGLSLATTTAEGAVDQGGMTGFALAPNLWARDLRDSDEELFFGWGDHTAGIDASLKVSLRGSKATRPPGPYGTNRNQQPRAAVAETGATDSKLATSFRTSASNPIDQGDIFRSSYQLTSVLLSVAAESGTVPRVAIHADSNGRPAADPLPNGTLTTPAGISTALRAPGRAEFTAGSSLSLTRDTTYWVVLDAGSGSGNLSVSTTASDEIDRIFPWGSPLGSVPGWSIGDTMKVRRGAAWSNDAEGRSFRIALNGTTDPFSGFLYLGTPQVGVGIRPLLNDESERVKNGSWQWQRGNTRDGAFTDIPAGEDGTVRRYVPSESDLGKWLRVSVIYEDGFGPGKSASAASLQPVLSGPPVVSNAGRDNAAKHVVGSKGPLLVAQAFTTGGDPSGYVLGGLRFGIEFEPLVDALSWTLHADDGGRPAADPLFAPLAVAPDTLDQNEKTFEDLPHPGYLLAPNTRYWAVLTATARSAANDGSYECGPQSPVDSMTPVNGDDAQLTVQFEQDSYQVVEGCRVDVTVTLSKDPERTVIVPIQAPRSDAIITSVPPSVTFHAGETERTFTITAVLDADGADELALLRFENLPEGVTEGDAAETYVTIYDDDFPVMGFAAISEWADSRVLDGIVAALDPGSEPGWSLDYSVLAQVEVDDEAIARGWIPFLRALEIQWGRSVLRMSVLLHPEVTASFGQASHSVGEGGEVDLTVSLSADPKRTVSIPISVTGIGGASAGDYSIPASVTFNAGETEQTITFMAVDDTVDDDDESVRIGFGTMPAGVSAMTPAETVVSINDDDDPIVDVSFGAPAYTVNEGGMQSVSVELSADPERTIVVPLAKTEQGGATAADYSEIPASLTFNQGETSKSFLFASTQDQIDDDAESVLLSFGSLPARVNPGAQAEVTVNIEDDDGAGVTISKASLTVDEQGSGTYTVVLDSEPTAEVTVTPSVGSGAPGLTVDPLSLTFDADDWSTAKTVTVSAAHDDDADDETTIVTHTVASTDSSYDGASAASVVVEVRDDDETVTFGQPSYTVAEGSEVAVTVTLSEDPERTVVIPIEATPQDGATADDYSVPGSVTFNAGETEQTITFKALDDTVEDDGESVLLAFGTLPVGVSAGSIVSSTVSITESCISGDLWCGTMTLRVSRHLDLGRADLVTDELDTDEFVYNGVTYGVRGITLEPNAAAIVKPSPPFHIPERARLDFVLWNLSATDVEGQWTMPNEDHRDWTLHISTEQDGQMWEATLPFSDAKRYLGDLWTWYGLDLDELNKAWAEDRLYKLRIVHDPRADRVETVPGPPMYLEAQAFDRSSVVLSWVRPQTRNDGAPPGVSYLVQWKEAAGSWENDGDISSMSYTPGSGREYLVRSVRGLAAGATYDFRVIAKNAAGDSEPSNVVTATTVPPLDAPQPQRANSPPTGWPDIRGTVQTGETLTADTSGIADEDGLTNAVFTYQWIRYDFKTDTDANIDDANDATYTVTADDENKAIKVRVTFTDDAGNEQSLTSSAYAVSEPLVIPDEEQGSEQQQAANNEPTGAPAVSGMPQVGETLTVTTSGIADADGMTDAVFAYQWVSRDLTTNTDTDIADANAATYTVAEDDQGKALKVRVTFTDDAGHEETLTSAATAAVPLPPLTAAIHDKPAGPHDGENAFTFELRFSETPVDGFSYKTLKNHAFTVTGGEVLNARRLDKPHNVRWEISVSPDGDGDVVITLPATMDCDDDGAICTADGRMLSSAVKLTVSGPSG